MKKPDFFIVGAPKCGTTALHQCLKQHPGIFMPSTKLDFFGKDLHFKTSRLTRQQYLQHFHAVKDEELAGDIYVMYLFSKLAASEIKQFNPHAKIIIMLRNPVDLIYSHHNQLIFDGDEVITNFQEALEAENDRKKGLKIPPTLINLVDGLYYKEIVKFYEQVKRYLDELGRENVHIILYDDLKDNFKHVYRETLKFLCVNTEFIPEIEVVNPSKSYHSYFLHRMMRQTPYILKWLFRCIVPFKPLRHNIMLHAEKMNVYYGERTAMNENLKRQLNNEFRDEIMQLGDLIGKDLNNWVTSE